MSVIRFTIPGAPTTKKNRAQIIPSESGQGAILVPNEKYRQWRRRAIKWKQVILTTARDAGYTPPIEAHLSCRALFYRPMETTGDFDGYIAGLGDFLEPEWVDPVKDTITRPGVGLIENDRQIRDWDGTRLLIDRENPRIEVELAILTPSQTGLDFQPVEQLECDCGRAFDAADELRYHQLDCPACLEV
jgi:hypothetical protein